MLSLYLDRQSKEMAKNDVVGLRKECRVLLQKKYSNEVVKNISSRPIVV